MDSNSPDMLEYLINHVFLPVQLPQKDDHKIEYDLAVCDLVIDRAEAFQSATFSEEWSRIGKMMHNLRAFQSTHVLDVENLYRSMQKLVAGDVLVIPVRTQNACLIVRKAEGHTVFEAFEVDPPNAQVMAAVGRVIRYFPEPAIIVPDETAMNSSFQRELASFIVNIDVETQDSAATTKKAGSKVSEPRDTADPHHILQLLMAIFRGLKGSVPADVVRVTKHTRNDILWKDAYKPWRRSPLWLTIRVALQTTLCRSQGLLGTTEFKAFMIFAMAYIPRFLNCNNLSSDVLHCMRAKLARRLRKLSPDPEHFVFDETSKAIEKISSILDTRWRNMQSRQKKSPPWNPDELDIIADTSLSLCSSREYIQSRLDHVEHAVSPSTFNPSEFPRLAHTLQDPDAFTPANLSAALSKDPVMALLDLEQFVATSLDQWAQAQLRNKLACDTVAGCIDVYAESAEKHYEGNPENESIRLLTIFQMWMALDRIATAQETLLVHYSTDIPGTLLEALLLRDPLFIERLYKLQVYLAYRRERSFRGSVFSNNITRDSFAVQCYDTSATLQKLKSTIEDDARATREAKREELRTKIHKYRSLSEQARSMEHEYYTDWKNGYQRHSDYGCPKCCTERVARGMEIGVHEWPLPAQDLLAKAVVFELGCSATVRAWRTTTYKILHDFCRPLGGLSNEGNPPVSLQTYDPLHRFITGNLSRVTYASSTKSFLGSHYASEKVSSATEDSICVANGLKFQLFDADCRRWLTDSFVDCDVHDLCTYKIPSGSPYEPMRIALQSNAEASNESIASQARAPEKITLHEYMAFSTLRCGTNLQWPNIARELRTRVLSFLRPEVKMLVAQAVTQIGPFSETGDPVWHTLLKCSLFGKRILDEVDDLLSSIEGNWLHIVTLQTAVLLVTRVLNTSPDSNVIDRACSILRRSREIALKWVEMIINSSRQSDREGSNNKTHGDDHQRRICAVALLCKATYDVCMAHLSSLLASASDVTNFVYSMILVHDNVHPSDSSDKLRFSLARDSRLSHSVALALLDIVKTDPLGLDNAITKIWPEYRRGASWRQLTRPNERWMTTETISDGEQQASVHLNLLNGTLLINGRPLQRLPSSILLHPTYSRILKSEMFDVIPSKMRGMDFATRQPILGSCFHLHFRLQQDTLLIHASRGSDVYELIPHHHFHQDFPVDFVEGYVHWLQLSPHPQAEIREIEFRPLENPWIPSPANWHLQFSQSPSKSSTIQREEQGKIFLIDVRSPTFKMVSGQLARLETPLHIHITTATTQKQNLVASLPRFNLSFSLGASGGLESRNFRGMVIDQDQFSGTMVTLSSQLVLRQNDPDIELFRSRSVIIPNGIVEMQREPNADNVVTIVVETKPSSSRYFKYDIDATLGALVSTTLGAELSKIYLHASTTYPLPDPLTGRTGTEEALSALGSAKCFSFQTLGRSELNLLQKIAELAPRRVWYPGHLEVMQSTQWNDLSPLGQHWGFCHVVKNILEFHDKLRIFGKNEAISTSAPPYNDHLLRRSASRHHSLYSSGYTFYNPLSSHDATYLSSNRASGHEPAAQLSANTTAMVQDWSTSLPTVSDLWPRIKSLGIVSGHIGTEFSLSYSQRCLDYRLQNIFLPLYDQCRKSDRSEAQYPLTFTLSILSYRSPDLRDFLPTFLAFATVSSFTVDSPEWTSFDMSYGVAPNEQELINLFEGDAIDFAGSPSYGLERRPDESHNDYRRRRESHHRSTCDGRARILVNKILCQWPCERPSWSDIFDSYPQLIRVSTTLKYAVGKLFEHWYRNRVLQTRIQEIQRVLDQVRSGSDLVVASPVRDYKLILPCSRPSPPREINNLSDLLKRNSPPLCHMYLHLTAPPHFIRYDQGEPNSTELELLFEEFTIGTTHPIHRRYGKTLHNSSQQRKGQIDASRLREIPFSLPQLKAYRDKCGQYFLETLNTIMESLAPVTSLDKEEHRSSLWPKITLPLLLGLLSETSSCSLSQEWRSTLVFLARNIIQYQRAQRLVRHQILNALDEFSREYDNDALPPGGDTDAEWLLIQIEGNFLMRPLQRLVAQEMMLPTSNENTLMQLNMGEGKSSVIVPLIASALANGKQLLRVVVLKPLARQMFNLLVRRLGGLANRRIFYLPFSRDVDAPATSKELHSLFELCMQERGILLVQPEHLLSFKLMGIDMVISSKQESPLAANMLLASQTWLTRNSRDVLDESDEILDAKYQLVYTSGTPEPLEDHPDRWNKIQEILHCARKHACWLQEVYPQVFKIEPAREGTFPIIRILDAASDAASYLTKAVAEDMLAQDPRFRLLSEITHQAALRFVLSNKQIDMSDSVLFRCQETSLWKYLLLLRGLLGCGILQFVLADKRWRVDYGLDPRRTLLAVPYRAKDVPTLRADFGHPDVAVALTCLSYYYSGLPGEKVEDCFQLLLKLDNPAQEYEKWVNTCGGAPSHLHQVIGINMEDRRQLEKELIPLFSANHAVIDFYLSNVVFPRAAKQFPKRLAASAWDLAEKKTLVTTGFSGTNDNCDLLPTTIQQRDPLDQLGTNAKVLGYLLQPENEHYLCLDDYEGHPISSRTILEQIIAQSPPVRVLLDVGAQMLDMQSNEIASTWLSLSMTAGIEAVVFFDDDDNIVVMTRDRSIEPFETSQFCQKLDLCAVYLDDAHTRGTDLNLPKYFRAAVTLGPRLTKDRLVQGCMRMRKLGHGQSLVFLAPREVDQAIRKARALAKLDPNGVVRPLDIIRWVMTETCNHIEHHLAHWAQQGVEYKNRQTAWIDFQSNMTEEGSVQKLRKSWEEKDARTLEEMYGPVPEGSSAHPAFADPQLSSRLEDLGVSSFNRLNKDEEQEREVSHEAEQEPQVERPREVKPAKHNLHPQVRKLIEQGPACVELSQSSAFVPLFSPLRHLAPDHEWSPNLLATKDFATTVLEADSSAKDYQRPVQWLLSAINGRNHILIAISPYEADELLPLIHQSKHVHLHTYAPRVTQGMKTFEDLDFFSIPPLPQPWTPPAPTDIAQLNLFAGQVYLKDHDAYLHLRMMLGLVGDETKGAAEQWWESDGFVKPENRRGRMRELCGLNSSPLLFLKEVVGLRRKGMAYQSTHIGKMLHGALLTPGDFS